MKDEAAVSLGRRGGLRGGLARAAALTQEQRTEIARAAARARWDRPRPVKIVDDGIPYENEENPLEKMVLIELTEEAWLEVAQIAVAEEVGQFDVLAAMVMRGLASRVDKSPDHPDGGRRGE